MKRQHDKGAPHASYVLSWHSWKFSQRQMAIFLFVIPGVNKPTVAAHHPLTEHTHRETKHPKNWSFWIWNPTTLPSYSATSTFLLWRPLTVRHNIQYPII